MSRLLKKSLLFAPFIVMALSFTEAPLYSQDEDRSDAVEYDLVDRMRSGKVFHDRSYPDPDRYYYCPTCKRYHEYSNGQRPNRRNGYRQR